MAKKVYLDRDRALLQMFRWQTVYGRMNEEVEKKNPKSIEQIVEDLQATWEKEFIFLTDGNKRKTKFPPMEAI